MCSMTEKKPIQPLLLFFIVAVLSFSTGAFVGTMITLNFIEESSVELDNSELEAVSEENTLTDVKELPEDNFDNQPKENKTLNRYKNMLKKSIDESSQNEEFFKSYGIVVGSYTNMEKANNIAIDLKSQYNWEIAVYPMDNFHKVIVGPFDSQESAEEFLQQMPKISRFIASKIIQFPTE